MEVAIMRISSEGGAIVKEEKIVQSCGDEEHFKDKIDTAKEKQLYFAKAEMGEVKEENQRLKRHLSHIMKDYQTLKTQFNGILGQEAKELKTTKACARNQEPEEPEFISLSLGRTSSINPKKDKKMGNKSGDHKQVVEEGLSLGLDSYNFDKSSQSLSKESSENSVAGSVKEQGIERSPSHSVRKTMRSEDDEVSPQNPAKRARVSVRVRCDTPTMNDGCQWRKYGQKISKGNPCPRAYYRCTVAPSCPVRKQVQRCADDMSILITTYEGTHNHSLPASATAMASTTSAAASMLLSGSSTSSSNGATSSTFHRTIPSPLHGLNYYISDNSRSNQFYLPTSSILSNSPSHPTITLDLTSHSNSISSKLFPTPNYSYNSSKILNFNSLESNPLPFSWSVTNSYDKNSFGNSLDFARHNNPQENYYQSFMPKANPNPNPSQQTLPQDKIVAATKAITSDPSFQSALAVALTSMIGNKGNGGEVVGNLFGSSKIGQNLKFGEQFSALGTQIGNRFNL